MGLIAWLLLTFLVAIILFAVFMYILGWIYPQEIIVKEASQETIAEESPQEVNRQKRLIYLFAFIIVIIIMACGGFNALVDSMTK